MNVIYDRQFGFQKSHSTAHAMGGGGTNGIKWHKMA